MESNICHICNSVPDDTEPIKLFSEDEIEHLLRNIALGIVTKTALDVPLYHKTAEKLMSGVVKGYGKNFPDIGIKYGGPDLKMLTSLRENVYVFSAAKDYQQTKDISKLLIKTDGKTATYKEFKEEARKVFDKYNENYLKAEYNSAIHQARSARLWEDIQKDKDLFPQLEYHTIGDQRVRREHAMLDKIIRPVDDKFWSVYMPPNGWSCRCTVLQTSDAKNTDLNSKTAPTKREVPEIFRFNPGQDKIIFSPKHPYFDIAKEDKSLAKNNFNLPLPKTKSE